MRPAGGYSLIVRHFSFVEDKDTGAYKQVCPYPCLCIVATIIANIDNICIYRYNSSSLHEAIQTQIRKEVSMIDFWDTPSDIAVRLAGKIKRIRKRKKITQKQLAARSNVSYASLKKFEQTGQISLESFIKLVMELGLIDEVNALFEQPVYSSIEEVLNDRK